MIFYLTKRLAKSLLLLLAVIVMSFCLLKAAPGDPVAVMAGEAGAADSVYVEQLRKQFGLDQPFIVQLGKYVFSTAQFDLGYSYRRGQSVWSLIWERLPATLLLTLSAFLVSLVVGIVLGAIAAAYRGRWIDSVITSLGLLFYATPLFWVSLMAVILLSSQLGWFPAFGYSTIGQNYSGISYYSDVLHHLVLPMLTLGLLYIAVYMRMTRASMLEVGTLDFVKTARAKGLTPLRVYVRHVLRNALLPIITMGGLQAGHLVGGSVLTETIFAWPGIGRLMFEALSQRDYNVLLGIFVVTSAMVLILNLLVDLLYGIVDPRVRAAT